MQNYGLLTALLEYVDLQIPLVQVIYLYVLELTTASWGPLLHTCLVVCTFFTANYKNFNPITYYYVIIVPEHDIHLA